MFYIAENIRYLRAKRNLTQKELATALRLSRNQINSYECANSQPSIEALQKLAAYFEIDIDTLINIELNKHILKLIQEASKNAINKRFI